MIHRLVFLIAVVSAAKFPSNVKRCNRHEPDFNKCMKESMQDQVRLLNKPNPSIKLPILDPFEIPSLDITGASGSVQADQHYKNCKIYGMSTAIVDSVNIDFVENTMTYSGSISVIEQVCDYRVSGTVLIIPVQGSGLSNITLYDNKITVLHKFHVVTKNGQEYWTGDNFNFQMHPDKMYINFENVVDGNKMLSDNVNKALNENWKDILNELGGYYFEAYGLVFNSVSNNLFKHFSLTELFG